MSYSKLAIAGAFAAALTLTTARGTTSKHKEAAAAPTAAQLARTQLDNDRNAYVTQTQARIDQMAKASADLRAKSGTIPKPQSKKLENAAEDMDSTLNDVRKELADVKTAAPENWMDEKRDVEKTMSRAETQYGAAVPLLQ